MWTRPPTWAPSYRTSVRQTTNFTRRTLKIIDLLAWRHALLEQAGAVGGYSGFRDVRKGLWMGEEWLECGHLDMADGGDLHEVFGLLDYACPVRCGDAEGVPIVELIPLGPYRPYGQGSEPGRRGRRPPSR